MEYRRLWRFQNADEISKTKDTRYRRAEFHISLSEIIIDCESNPEPLIARMCSIIVLSTM